MPLKYPNLKGKVAIVSGGSRGIGRECCLALARAGCTVIVAAKSIKSTKNLPGSIFTVAKECQDLGAEAIGIQMNLLDEKAIQNCVDQAVARFGRIDILINNASALWWQDILDTPTKKYDLITGINSRGTFLLTKACLPHMEKNGFGRVINMSPPIRLDAMAGKTAYNISKFGMTLVALGVAAEFEGEGITGNTLWPATVIESYASINFKLGERKMWRKATILADCVMGIIAEPDSYTGNMLIDDDYLRTRWNFQDADFIKYRYDPEHEPPRILAMESAGELDLHGIGRRGDVSKVDEDILRARM